MAEAMTVFISGGAGNLGGKLAAHLSAMDWCGRIILADVAPPSLLPPKAEALAADLLDPRGDWVSAVQAADAIVHFAAINPYPDCSFAEASDSFAMTANIMIAAAAHKSRFVFASSNHVMGRYKEERLAPGTLTPALPPLPGTRSIGNGVIQDSPAYATAKLMGERLLASLCAQESSAMTGLSLRIGWCQPGENAPETITADGLRFDAPRPPMSAEMTRDLHWFRSMWLSNRDFASVFAAAIRADAAAWPQPAMVLNAMSGNAGMPWDLAETTRWLDYQPADDAFALLG